MSNLNTLLLEQLKGLGIDPNTESPTSEQWSQLLNLVSLTYAEVDYERTLQKEAQVSSAHVLKKLHNNLEESQRISGFGRWSFNLQSKIGDWTNECSRVFGLTPFSSMPNSILKSTKSRLHFLNFSIKPQLTRIIIIFQNLIIVKVIMNFF